MSNDCELLEMAAKAYWGEEIDDVCSVEWDESDNCIAYTHGDNQDHNGNDQTFLWNPLTDDGDALRLLAAMPSLWSLGLKFGSPSIVMDVAWGFKGIKVTKFNGQNTDRAAVIRRAIVEAAAVIGRESGDNPMRCEKHTGLS